MSAIERLKILKEEQLMAALLVRLNRRIQGLETIAREQPPRRKPVRAEGNVVPFVPLSTAPTPISA